MPDRRYKPGYRRNAQLRGTGKMSESRFAWLRTAIGQFVIMRYGEVPETEETEETEKDTEIGPTIRLYLPRPGQRPVQFNITALTEEELKMTREFFDLLFDLAEPIVKERDKVAHDALAAGDDSFARVYRAVPQLIIRERAQSGYSQSLLDRPPSDAHGVEPVTDTLDGVYRNSGALADGQQAAGSSEDDGAQVD